MKGGSCLYIHLYYRSNVKINNWWEKTSQKINYSTLKAAKNVILLDLQCMDGQKCCNYRAASLPKKEYKIVKLNVL